MIAISITSTTFIGGCVALFPKTLISAELHSSGSLMPPFPTHTSPSPDPFSAFNSTGPSDWLQEEHMTQAGPIREGLRTPKTVGRTCSLSF